MGTLERSSAGHGNGSNLANAAPPDLPTEERTTDVEAWRKRIEERRQGRGQAERERRAREVAADYPMTEGRASTSAGDRTTTASGNEGERAGATIPPAVTSPAPGPASPTPKPAPRSRPTVDERTRRTAAMVTAYLAGDSTTDLARRYEISPTTVANYLRAAGVTLRPKGHRADPTPSQPPTVPSSPAELSSPPAEPTSAAPPAVPPDRPRTLDASELAEIVREYGEGQSAPQIARAHGRMPKTIRDALRRAGVQLRDDRSLRSGGQNRTQDDDELVAKVRRLYVDEQRTQAEVAAELGVSPKKVQGVMSRNGIEARPDAIGHRPEPRDQATRSTARTVRYLADANPAIGAGHVDADAVAERVEPDALAVPVLPPPTFADAVALDPLEATHVLDVTVHDVAAALHDVVDATEALLAAQRQLATLRVTRLRALADELLAVLEPTPEQEIHHG